MINESESFFVRYVRYLKQNPQGYWFRCKVYGWGWFPARWQGFVTLGMYVLILLLLVVQFFALPVPRTAEVTWFLSKVALWAVAFLGTLYIKGEPLKWQWGIPKE